jgi:hypothetical protein
MLSAACAQKRFDEFVDKIKNDKHAIVVGTGDYFEGIHYKDIRFAAIEMPVNVRACDLANYSKYSFDMLYDTLKPIASKILGLGYGNHEQVLLERNDSMHLWKDFLQRLGCANLGYTSFLDLIFQVGKRDHVFRVFTHHGAGFATKAGGVVNRLEDFMTSFDADIYLMGHLHKQEVHPMTVVGVDSSMTKIIASPKLGVIGGSYLRGYTDKLSTYGEKRGYRPVGIGNPCVEIQPETRECGVTWPK